MTQHEIKVESVPLAGVGLRLEFVTGEGQRVGVVHRQDGGYELFLCNAGEPDRVTASAGLSPTEAHALTDMLGGSSFSHEVVHLHAAATGVVVDWVPLEEGVVWVGRALGETRLRTTTGVSIVAVIRGGEPHPSPSPGFLFEAGDVLVAVGTAESLEAATEILSERG